MSNLVSIIIPTYNRAHLIGETIKSVIDQTYKNWECIIVDDGSNDKTMEVVESFSKDDQRIKLFNRPKENIKGASSCRNYGLEKAKGEFIQFLDSDDIISDNKIEVQVELLEENPESSIATCKWGTFAGNTEEANIHEKLDAYNNFQNPLEFLNAMGKAICYFPINAYLIRRSVISKAGFWNEYLSLNDDAEFMIRVIINSSKIYFSGVSTAFYRLPGENNLSLFGEKEKVQEAIYSWKLIENYLKIRFKNDEVVFLERAKNDFYRQAKKFPELIKMNREFFKEQLEKESFLIKMFGRYLLT